MPYGTGVSSVKGMTQKTALITGASRGLGRALARTLSQDGWRLIITARGAEALETVANELPGAVAFPGDVGDSWHRAGLAAEVEGAGGLDLLVNNASTLGAAPLPRLDGYPLSDLQQAFATNVVAPL